MYVHLTDTFALVLRLFCLRLAVVPRPVPAGDTLRLSAYELVGQFIGLALRSGNLLPFSFPSIVWKHLVSEEVTTDDVRAYVFGEPIHL
jgi:hypothetical protein